MRLRMRPGLRAQALRRHVAWRGPDLPAPPAFTPPDLYIGQVAPASDENKRPAVSIGLLASSLSVGSMLCEDCRQGVEVEALQGR